MPKSLADGRRRIDFLATKPANPAKLTLAEAAAAIPLSSAILSTGFTLGPTGSDTVNEKPLDAVGNAAVLAASNYTANATFFRYLTAAAASEDGQDVAYEVFAAGKGVHGWLIDRGPTGTPKLAKEPFATGDIYDLYEITADDKQSPSELTGYVKFVQPMAVDSAELGGVITGA